jgi:hypothetical protein
MPSSMYAPALFRRSLDAPPALDMDRQSDDLSGGHLLLRRQRRQVSSGQCPRRPCAGRRSSLRPTSPRDREGDEPVREIAVGNRLRMPMELASARRQCGGRGGQDIGLAVPGWNEPLDNLSIFGDVHPGARVIDPPVEADHVLCVAAVYDCLRRGSGVVYIKGRASAGPHATNSTASTRAPREIYDRIALRRHFVPSVGEATRRRRLASNCFSC